MAGYKDLPQNRDVAGKVIEATAALDIKKAEIGALGWLLGDDKHRPGAIAFITILLSLIGAVCCFIFVDQNDPSRLPGITLFGGLVTTCVGYLFGKTHTGA